MNKARLRILSIFAVISLVLADVCVGVWAAQTAIASPDWWQIVAAVSLQLVTILALLMWVSLGSPSSQSFDGEASYRRQLPITLIGIVLILLALSFDLLYTGIACPAIGIPSVRGHKFCEK